MVRSLRSSADSSGLPPLEDELASQIAAAAAADEHRPPSIAYRPTPRFPRAVNLTHGTDEALIQFTILANGHVSQAKAESFSDPDFAADAANFVQDWRFVPTIRDGAPVSTEAEVTIEWVAG